MPVQKYDLISSFLTRHIKNDFAGKKNIYYYINNNSEYIYTNAIAGGRDFAESHPQCAETFIENIFDNIDSYIHLDFHRTFNKSQGNIDIYYLGDF